MLTFIDFFSGIGGFRLGMELAGHKCLGHCESDKYAEKSYRAMHNVKESEWFGEDIRKVRSEELPAADVWCAGFPCQDISIGGNKLGFKYLTHWFIWKRLWNSICDIIGTQNKVLTLLPLSTGSLLPFPHGLELGKS